MAHHTQNPVWSPAIAAYSSYRQGRSPLTDFGLNCRLLTLWLLERPNHTQKSFWRVKSTFSQSLRIPKNCLLSFLSCFFFGARGRHSRPASTQSDTQNDTETAPLQLQFPPCAGDGPFGMAPASSLSPVCCSSACSPPSLFPVFVVPLAPTLSKAMYAPAYAGANVAEAFLNGEEPCEPRAEGGGRLGRF